MVFPLLHMRLLALSPRQFVSGSVGVEILNHCIMIPKAGRNCNR